MRRFKPNTKYSRVMQITLLVLAGLILLLLISTYLQWNLIHDIMGGKQISFEEADSNDTRQLIIFFTDYAFSIITFIMFIIWFKRAYTNIYLKSGTLEHEPGWTIGGWFIPFACWLVPFFLMRAMKRKTIEFLFNSEDNEKPKVSLAIINIWWLFFVIFALSITINNIFLGTPKNIDELIRSQVLLIILSVIQFIDAFLTYFIVKDYHKYEVQLAELHIQNPEPKQIDSLPESTKDIDSVPSDIEKEKGEE